MKTASLALALLLAAAPLAHAKTAAPQYEPWPAGTGGPEYDPHGHALVYDGQGLLYIDRAGRPVLRPFIYDNGPDYPQEGLARFVENGKMGFHDETLKIVIPARYDFVFPFENGKARAGTDCRTQRDGEHSIVSCKTWEEIGKPGR